MNTFYNYQTPRVKPEILIARAMVAAGIKVDVFIRNAMARRIELVASNLGVRP